MALTAQRQLAGQQHLSLCAARARALWQPQGMPLALPGQIGAWTGQSLLLCCCLSCAVHCRVELERSARQDLQGGGLWRALFLIIDLREAFSVPSKLTEQAKGLSCWQSIRKEEHGMRDVLQQIRIRALTCSLAPSRGCLKML